MAVQTRAVVAPYGDLPIHVPSLWMLSDFTPENGATFIVLGSHRAGNNPAGDIGHAQDEPVASEVQAVGKAGSVLMFDSRMWHSPGVNRSTEKRVALAVRYAPWWFTLDRVDPGIGRL